MIKTDNGLLYLQWGISKDFPEKFCEDFLLESFTKTYPLALQC